MKIKIFNPRFARTRTNLICAKSRAEMRKIMKKRVSLLAAAVTAAAVLLFAAASFLLPGRRQDAMGHTPDLSREYLVTQYADASGAQGTFYTIENDSSFLIIDGGWAENEQAVREVIGAHGNVVDAWIISHPHRDHAGAFNAIFADPGEIEIKAVYDNGFDYDFIESVGEPYDDITVMETYHALTADDPRVTHLARGQVTDICGLTFRVLNAYDDTVLAAVGDEKDYQNSASLLLRVESAHSSMLFCSDIKYDMNDTLLAAWGSAGADLLSCDYVQTGHHGNWSFSDEFYDATGASVFFFDAPSGITENADFPASRLASYLSEKNGTVLDFRTAPNRVTLK